jgi:hypothetical protein
MLPFHFHGRTTCSSATVVLYSVDERTRDGKRSPRMFNGLRKWKKYRREARQWHRCRRIKTISCQSRCNRFAGETPFPCRCYCLLFSFLFVFLLLSLCLRGPINTIVQLNLKHKRNKVEWDGKERKMFVNHLKWYQQTRQTYTKNSVQDYLESKVIEKIETDHYRF